MQNIYPHCSENIKEKIFYVKKCVIFDIPIHKMELRNFQPFPVTLKLLVISGRKNDEAKLQTTESNKCFFCIFKNY